METTLSPFVLNSFIFVPYLKDAPRVLASCSITRVSFLIPPLIDQTPCASACQTSERRAGDSNGEPPT